MSAYVARRVLLTVPTLFLVVSLLFILIRLIPGDIVDLMIEDNHYAPSADALRKQLGIDGSIQSQYFHYLGRLARGDLGRSLKTNTTVWSEVRTRAPVSMQLGAMTLIVSVGLAIPVGVLSAMKSNTLPDYGARGFAVLMLSIPNFWLATMVIIIPSLLWNKVIITQYVPLTENPLQNLRLLIIPALISGASSSAGLMRLTRTMMLDVARQDYVRTAQSKGLGTTTIITRHMLRNALIPIVTVLGLTIPVILGGSVIMEQIFGLPGMGRFLLTNLQQRDYPMVQATTLMFGILVMASNLIVDLLYPLIDPRIKVGGGTGA